LAYIYKITNKLNGKIYVGKTEFSVEKRFKEHKADSIRITKEKRPLYSAMRKYGTDNFKIEVLEKVKTNDSIEREIYWIKKLKSFSNGYNATVGGDGKKYLDYDKIIKDYNEHKSITEVARINNCHFDSVRKLLIANDIVIISSSEVNKKRNSKEVCMLSKDTEEIIQTFYSQREAARFLIENNYSNISDVKSASGKISLVCRGKRKTFGGFRWKYSISDIQ